MQNESNQLNKTMQNRHLSVSQFSESQLTAISYPSASSNNSSITPKTIESQPVANQIEGYLFKRTSKGFKSWNRRWFYLRNNQLLYV